MWRVHGKIGWQNRESLEAPTWWASCAEGDGFPRPPTSNGKAWSVRPMDLSFKLNNFSRLASFFLPSYDSLAYKVTCRPGFVPIRLELSSGLLASDHQQANTRGLLLVPDLTLSSPILGFQDSLPFYSRLHHVLCQTNLYFLPHLGSELPSTLKLNNK